MSLTVIATLKVKSDKSAVFESAMRELQDGVLSNEPGCMEYRLCQAEAGDYVMVERYANEKALEQHQKTIHFKKAVGTLAECLEGAPSIQVLKEV